MYPCRAALQRFSSLSRHSMTHRVILHRDVVPRRLMSSVPGGTGENVMLVLLCGGAFAAAVTYAYRTVCRDSARFNERITEIAARPKNEGKTKPWTPKNAEEVSAVAAPPEAKVEEAALAPVELADEVNRADPTSVVETVAEVVVEAVAEVAVVVEETAKEVAAVAHEVEKVAEEVEAAAKELETPALPVVEETAAERNATQDLTELVAASVEVVPVEVKLEKPGEALATPVAEEALVALVEETPVVEETPGVEEPSVAPAVVEVKHSPEVEEDTVSPVVQEVPDTPEVEKASVAPVIEEVIVTPAVQEIPVTPVVEETAVASEVEEVTVVEEAPSVAPAATEGTKVPVPSESPIVSEAVETTASPAAQDESESNHEYVVVVLEGEPKTEKKLKVLGVSPIIPAPEDENPAELVTG